MNELLSRINESFDNCMSNSNDDTKLQLRILKNNINALFAEYGENSYSQPTTYTVENDIVQDIEENDFEPSEIEYEQDFETESTVPEQNFVVEEPVLYNNSVVEEPIVMESPIPEVAVYGETVETVVMEQPIPSYPIPEPVPITPVQPTIQEAFAPNNDKYSILIVDDSSIVRNYLEKVFMEDYNVNLAVDGQDAIDKISDDEFIKNISLIILDLMMPNIDGFGVLEYISGRHLNIPIMVISGDNSKETINRAFQYNVVDVIEKPFDAQKLKDKMHRFINL